MAYEKLITAIKSGEAYWSKGKDQIISKFRAYSERKVIVSFNWIDYAEIHFYPHRTEVTLHDVKLHEIGHEYATFHAIERRQKHLKEEFEK